MIADTRELVRLRSTLRSVQWLCRAPQEFALFWLTLKHPLLPIQREWLNPGKTPSSRWLLRFFGAGCCGIGYAIYLSSIIAWTQGSLREQIKALRQKSFQIIAKTWGFGPDQAIQPADFYFGDLPQRLSAESGVEMLLICGNAGAPGFLSFAKRYTRAARPSRIFEFALIPRLSPVLLYGRQIVSSVRFLRLSFRAKNPRLVRALKEASITVLRPQTTRDALQFDIARAAVRQWNPSVYLTLYEGHAWEKCAWWGAQTENPRIRTAGYQHTVIFQQALSITAPILTSGARFIPDISLTLGDIPLTLLRPVHDAKGRQLIRLGSFRYQKDRATVPGNPAHRWILVTPEGMTSEMRAMFRYTYARAQEMPDSTFVIRTHPAIPLAQILPDLPPDFTTRPNIVISTEKDIHADFKRCTYLMYRGSSTVLYAILRGIQPLYIAIPDMMDIDPLYDLKCWRVDCHNPAQFVETVDKESLRPEADRQREWSDAVAYVTSYTMPIDQEGINAFLNAVNLPKERVS